MQKKGVRLGALGAALVRALQETEQPLVRQLAGKATKAQVHLAPEEPEKQAKAVLGPAQRQRARRTGALPLPARTRTYSKRSRESRTRKP